MVIKNKKISIVTANLNTGRALKNTINNLEKLKDSYEFIIIDGASIDDSLSVISKANNLTHYITESDSGISDAFNKGIKYSNNEYVLFLNAGDLLADGAIDIYFSTIDEYPDVDVFYGDLKYFSDKNIHGYIEIPNINNIWKFMSIYHPGMLVKKSAYEKIGGYDLNYHYAMDSEWVHRAIKSNMKFHYIPHVLAKMSLGGKSDKYFYFSLIEFCRSSIKHGPSKIKPLYYLARQLIVHSLLKIPFIKHWRLKKNTNQY